MICATYFPTMRVYNPSLLIVLVHWRVKMYSSEYELEVEIILPGYTPQSVFELTVLNESQCALYINMYMQVVALRRR